MKLLNAPKSCGTNAELPRNHRGLVSESSQKNWGVFGSGALFCVNWCWACVVSWALRFCFKGVYLLRCHLDMHVYISCEAVGQPKSLKPQRVAKRNSAQTKNYISSTFLWFVSFATFFGCFVHPLSLFIDGRMIHISYYKRYSVVKTALEFWAFLQYFNDIFELLQCVNFVTFLFSHWAC